nr:hypothetical protein [Candidatus Liberibacter solanacearum]
MNASENRISAIGDFVFNLGIGNYNKSTFKKCVDAQDWDNALKSVKDGFLLEERSSMDWY